jgi:hypothetical protein
MSSIFLLSYTDNGPKRQFDFFNNTERILNILIEDNFHANVSIDKKI